jgi:hypothetical protein
MAAGKKKPNELLTPNECKKKIEKILDALRVM